MEEPWLRGTWGDVPPALRAVVHSFEMAREDLERWTAGLTAEQTWATSFDLPSVGFQLRHIAGSVDRLLTYAHGRSLSDAQLAELAREKDPGEDARTLLAALTTVLERATARVRSFDPAALDEPRFVGRKRLPTTVLGLLIHAAEHTQRHVGQAITTAKVVRRLPKA